MRLSIILILIGLAIGGGVYYTKFLRAEEVPNFRTVAVQRGDLVITIEATGPIEPEELVDVGAQVVGRIQSLGLDPRGETDPKFKGKTLDYGSPVKKDMIVAEIDPALFKATRDQAKAGLERAEADLLQAQAKAAQTEAEWKRAQRLREIDMPSLAGVAARGNSGSIPTPKKILGISDADFILAEANYKVAQANVGVCEAAVDQAKATLFSAETNLGYTKIVSPVDGTIIDRRVNVGQTVVSSLNAPSLFLLAQDLREMEIWAAVNEADIGRLKVGTPATFTVDAFPDDVFHGTVSQIRLNAKETNNVITYTVTVATKNDDLRLLPYLSAQVKFEVERHDGVLLVPNAALRYRPRPELIGPAPALSSVDAEKTAAIQDDNGGPTILPSNHRQLWIQNGRTVYPLDVEIGATDGMQTEIKSGALSEGMVVVEAEERAEVKADETTNPFFPPRFKKKDGDKSKDKS